MTVKGRYCKDTLVEISFIELTIEPNKVTISDELYFRILTILDPDADESTPGYCQDGSFYQVRQQKVMVFLKSKKSRLLTISQETINEED